MIPKPEHISVLAGSLRHLIEVVSFCPEYDLGLHSFVIKLSQANTASDNIPISYDTAI